MRPRRGPVAGAALVAAALVLWPAQISAGRSSPFFVIAGRGWGHGVGMSQYGAEGFARAGYDYRSIIAHYYRGAGLARAPDVPVRVLLADGAGTVAVSSAGSIAVRDARGRSFAVPAGRYVLRRDLTLAARGRRVALRAPVRLDPVGPPLALDGSRYRGALVLGRSGSGLSVVNELPVELYLRGVVPSEMPAGWRAAALRAQAVAARSYALASLAPDRPFDLYRDTRSQMYRGVAAERRTSDRAVSSTAGEVVAWHRRVARTYYYASSGGCTAAASDVFSPSAKLPYLSSEQDPYDFLAPQHSWGPIRVSAADLGARLGLPGLTSLHVHRNGSGRVRDVAAQYAGGERTIPGSSFARGLGLPSTWFDVGVGRAATPVIACTRATVDPPAPRARKGRAVVLRNANPRSAAATIVAGILARSVGALAIAATPRPFRPLVRLALALAPPLEPLPGRVHPPTARRVGRAVTLPQVSLPRPPSVVEIAPPPLRPPAPLLPTPATPALTPTSLLELRAGDPAPAEAPVETPAPAPAPPPPPKPLEIADVSLASLDAAGARIVWRTSFAARVQAARGIADEPIYWTGTSGPDLQHETRFTGLADGTAYTVWLRAQDSWGRIATARLELSTPPAPAAAGPVAATAAGGTILLDGRPFFPRMVWDACTDQYPALLATGINLFMGDVCTKPADQLAQLDGRAYSAARSGDAADGKGLIGAYLTDELDAFLQPEDWQQRVDELPAPVPGRLTFLTLTNHFYGGAAPLEIGRDIYPPLVAKADVVGFDLYPLQEWCNPGAIGDVFDAQRELVRLAGGKPTFQWIEARQMKCADAADDVTPATVRAETWLAVAGGANGIGYFPNTWAPEVGAEIVRTGGQIQELAPALLGATAEASSDGGAVRVGARSLDGALYVIAVNALQESVRAAITVPGLVGREVSVHGEGRTILPSGDGFADDFAPLGVHVYVVPPSSWTAEAPAAAPPDAASAPFAQPGERMLAG